MTEPNENTPLQPSSTQQVQTKELQEEEYHETTTCSTGGIVTFVLGLIAGTFSALLCKMAYDTSAEGIDGEVKLFAKPIMMLLLMFSGMVPAIIFWLIQQYCFTKNPADREVVSASTLCVLIIPSICDLLCTLLLLVAQLYITASLWQMMRGSIIVITALLKRFVLSHRLKKHMWLGVAIITIAMLLVASTSFLGDPAASAASPSSSSTEYTTDDIFLPSLLPSNTSIDISITHEHSSSSIDNHDHSSSRMLAAGGGVENGAAPAAKDPRIGILLVVVGCLAQGVQYVFEEKVMAVDNAPPLVVIGFEGLWGTILTLVLVYPVSYLLPGSDNGSFEDPFDAWYMITHSKSLSYLAMAFVLTVTCYNCMAVYVTKYLSAIWHAILDNFRPVTIWALDLAIFYTILPGQGFGEQWISASWLQLGGLLVLFLGTAVYNGSVYLFDDATAEPTPPSPSPSVTAAQTGKLAMAGEAMQVELPLQRSNSLLRTNSHMASPALMRSPLIYHPKEYDDPQQQTKVGVTRRNSAGGGGGGEGGGGVGDLLQYRAINNA